MATGCRMGLAGNMPGAFMFQPTDPRTNQPVGTPNMPMDMPMGGSQTFMFAFTPMAAMDATELAINFSCANTGPAEVSSRAQHLPHFSGTRHVANATPPPF